MSIKFITIEFTLPPLRSKSVYRINQAVLSVNLKLTKANGEALPSSSITAPGNNILNAIFKSSSIFLNNVPVNTSSSFHYLKSGLMM